MPEVFVAVITGRCLPDIMAKVSCIISPPRWTALTPQVDIPNITYAGNHGLDIMHPDGSRFVPPLPEEVEERARELLHRLEEDCCKEGAWVENKGVVLAFHHEAWGEKGRMPEERKEVLLARARQLMLEAGFK